MSVLLPLTAASLPSFWFPVLRLPFTGARRGGGPNRPPAHLLLDDLRHPAGADGAAALADREAQALLHGDRLDQLDLHLGVVTGHDHLRALRQVDHAGDIRGAEVELRPVVVEERRVPPALVLGQDVDLALELGVWG